MKAQRYEMNARHMDGTYTFIMSAPMVTIAKVFTMHPDAVSRLTTDCAENVHGTFHKSKGEWAGDFVLYKE